MIDLRQNPTDLHEIPYWSVAESGPVMEALDEARAKQKYAQMMADAQFQAGSIIDLEV